MIRKTRMPKKIRTHAKRARGNDRSIDRSIDAFDAGFSSFEIETIETIDRGARASLKKQKSFSRRRKREAL